MKKLILIALSIFLYANTSYAAIGDLTDSIVTIKTTIVTELKSTINALKGFFKSAEDELIAHKTTFEEQQQTADVLYTASQTAETNVTVMKQGKANMPSCSASQELYWTGSSWACREPLYKFDCQVSSDEYRTLHSTTSAGPNYVCTKGPNGTNPSYYWQFRGYTNNCVAPYYREQVYGCYYKNKKGEVVEVSSSYCSGKSKPSAPQAICYSPWKVTAYGSCQSNSTRYRTEYCPTNYNCVGDRYTGEDLYQTCYASRSYGSWSSCSAECGGGTMTRAYYGCPTNHICKDPILTVASCNTQECPVPEEEPVVSP